MKNTTSGPFKIALSMRLDYKQGIVSLDFFQDQDGMMQDKRILTRRYEVKGAQCSRDRVPYWILE